MTAFRPARVALGAAALACALPLGAQQAARPEAVDTAAIGRIVREATERSQVMELASWMTDVYGSRLTGTPGMKAAGEWARATLAKWGLANAALEPFAVAGFDRGWTNERFSMQVVAPTRYPVIATPSAWTAGTNGPVTADVVMAVITDTMQLAGWKGKLRGKLVMAAKPSAIEAHWKPEASRLSDEDLAKLAAWAPSAPGAPGARPQRDMAQFRAMMAVRNRVSQFLQEEGAIGVLTEGRGDGGTIFSNNGGQKDAKQPISLTQVMVASESYGRIARTLEKGVPVTVELNVENRFLDATPNLFNVVAEIPGTDPKLKGEVVMLGAHYDAWHTATGATDNAAGSAVMMEAVRILKALNLPMKRTVRIALWTGEEQGLHGSRQYVRAHFGDTATRTRAQEMEHARFSAYFNVDNGTGKIRGVYAQGNQAVAPVFQAWLAPFRTMGATTVTLQNTGGTDHLAFDAVGLPGFQFIQDPVEYGTRTHHSNMDTWERLQAGDMKHNAAVVASFVYLAAQRGEKLPRKPVAVQSAAR